MRYDAVIVAGGSGKRAALGKNKVLFCLKDGKTVLEKACSLFLKDKDCVRVIVVFNEELPFEDKKIILTKGGKERYDSVKNGLSLCKEDYVLIHDGARPFLKEEDLNNVKKAVVEKKAVLLAIKAVDTIKYVEKGQVKKTLDREKIYLAATPQAFSLELIKEAYEKESKEGITDDVSLIEAMGKEVFVVEGNKDNIKLTRPEDFEGL